MTAALGVNALSLFQDTYAPPSSEVLELEIFRAYSSRAFFARKTNLHDLAVWLSGFYAPLHAPQTEISLLHAFTVKR